MLLNGVQDAEEVGGPEFGDVLVTETGFQEADGYVDGVVVSVETPATTAAVKVAGDAYVVYSCYLDAMEQVVHKVVEGGIGLLEVHIIRDDVDHDQAVLADLFPVLSPPLSARSRKNQ